MIVLFKQKTAYEMRISDWSSDVCSSDLLTHPEEDQGVDKPKEHRRAEDRFPRVAVAEGRKEITERAKDQHGIGNVAEPGAKPVAPGAVETNEVAETGACIRVWPRIENGLTRRQTLIDECERQHSDAGAEPAERKRVEEGEKGS